MNTFLTRQRIPSGGMRVLDLRRDLLWLLGYALFFILLSGCTAQLIKHWPLPLLGSNDFLLDAWYVFFLKITFLLLLPLVAYWKLGYKLADAAPGGLTKRDYIWSVIAFAAGVAINSQYLPPILQQVQTVPVIVGALVALFNAAIPEEFFYRYLLQTRLEQRFGRLIAIAGTALLFTAWHIPTRYFLASGAEGNAGNLGSVVINTGIPVLIAGLVLGFLWDRNRRLLPLIALHWGIDILPLTSALLGLHH